MGSIVYLAGNSWDAVAGTDKNLATALAGTGHVLWIDPPVSIHRTKLSQRPWKIPTLLEEVTEDITRLRTFGPPGVTKPAMRRGTKFFYHLYIRRAVESLGLTIDATICASPIMTFPRKVQGPSLFFVTDDWTSGASLMGFSKAHVRRAIKDNAGRATVVAAVTDYLARGLSSQIGRKAEVLPNGCRPSTAGYAADPGFAKAALIGQLNERLDFGVLDAVARTGIHISVAGPKTAKSPAAVSRLESFLSLPNVHWAGVLDSDGVTDLLASSNVGLTPYADTQFNRSSFPLKTLEYVAAGVPVVATDLPASRFDQAAKVRVAKNAEDFARAVVEVSARWPTHAERAEQAKQAMEHSWESRAEQVRSLLKIGRPSGVMATRMAVAKERSK